MQKFFSFMTGAVIGALVGATLSILFAPSSGTELRLEMRERAQQLQAEVKTAAETRRAELEQQLNTLRAPRS